MATCNCDVYNCDECNEEVVFAVEYSCHTLSYDMHPKNDNRYCERCSSELAKTDMEFAWAHGYPVPNSVLLAHQKIR